MPPTFELCDRASDESRAAAEQLTWTAFRQPDRPAPDPFPQLTEREHEVLELLARGRRNAMVAGRLFLGERTVRNYVSNIFTELQVADRAQAIAAARDVGIGQPPT